jgi:sulfite reductase alpha subunit-like flavoprotein
MFGTAEDVAYDVFEDQKTNGVAIHETKYAVCALGASYHKEFCGAGRKIDARMEELGAERISEMHKCDDDDEGAREYSVEVIKKILG